jgi:hypothetical protein
MSRRNLSHFTPHIVLLLLSIALAVGQTGKKEQEPFSYKGIKLGMTASEFWHLYQARFAHEGWSPKDSSTVVDVQNKKLSCDGGSCSFEVAENIGMLSIDLKFTNDSRLYFLSVTGFLSDAAEAFAKAFTNKYGAPRHSKNTYQNGFGALFSGEEWDWVRGRSLLTVEERCQKVDQSCLSMMDGRLEAQARKEATVPVKID